MATKRGAEAPPTERVQAAYKQLSLAAKSLNVASDELAKAISVLDAALQKLNLGVSAWEDLSGNEDTGTGSWWTRQIGYAKVHDKWGVALRTVRGNYSYPDDDLEELSLFNDAPRWMRIEAVGKIPDLLEALLIEAEKTTQKIKNKTRLAYELAAAMSNVGQEVQDAEGEHHAHPAK
jgi:hypothetical protein